MRRLFDNRRKAGAFVLYIVLIASVSTAASLDSFKAGSGTESGLYQGGQSTMQQSYQELFDISQKEKKGLTFFVEGQTIAGIVVRQIGGEAVEVRNQTFSRIIIRLESIDAVAIN